MRGSTGRLHEMYPPQEDDFLYCAAFDRVMQRCVAGDK